MPTIRGNCYVCGKTAAKTAMKNHVAREHGGGAEVCYLVRAEGVYDKKYWILFSVSLGAALSALDRFLRQIWCECCGHMSAFRRGEQEFGKTRKVSSLAVGDTLLYEYDFGTTTEVRLTILAETTREPQREKVRLLARNEPPQAVCDKCGAPAVHINVWEGGTLCGGCAKDVEDEAALLPITNSPRCGECAYDGEQDKWTFDPNHLNLSEAARTAQNRPRNYVWVFDPK